MSDETKRPEIYDYLDKKFCEMYKMFDKQGNLISELSSEFRSFKDKERPIKDCRNHIEAVTGTLERRKANKLPSAILTLVVGVIILGSYAYTTVVWTKVEDAINRNSKVIKELTNVMEKIR